MKVWLAGLVLGTFVVSGCADNEETQEPPVPSEGYSLLQIQGADEDGHVGTDEFWHTEDEETIAEIQDTLRSVPVVEADTEDLEPYTDQLGTQGHYYLVFADDLAQETAYYTTMHEDGTFLFADPEIDDGERFIYMSQPEHADTYEQIIEDLELSF
ncbi:hypothetical protein [Salsuginibacillus kocurii]|uniref:hypothetical protein n=1 Tax=Salsuginibacillus kocurii TaxID=427078 RepID=UPI000379B404|nr:hypothetical protein [Salsuginibacillus kocurii]